MTPTPHHLSPRRAVRRLVALRCVEDGKPTWTGFASTISLGAQGTTLELPDRMVVGQSLALEFLLDENQVVQVEGTVTKITRAKNGFHVAVEFVKPDAQAKRLLAKA